MLLKQQIGRHSTLAKKEQQLQELFSKQINYDI